jgi:CheY-like chemotaxis protein
MTKLILVVEDEAGIRDLLVELIDGEDNYKATSASNGLVALDYLKTITFNLITLDMNMPEMEGNEFLQELSKVAPTIPVIVITATPQKLRPHKQVKASIAKPFEIDELLSNLKSFCN